MQAVLTPDIDDTVVDATCIRYFVLHGGILVAVLVMTLGLGQRLERGAAWRVWRSTLILAALVFLVNLGTGANYMYLMGPPERPSILDWLGGWPWSLLGLAGLATALILVCCAPFWVAARLRSAGRHAASAHTA